MSAFFLLAIYWPFDKNKHGHLELLTVVTLVMLINTCNTKIDLLVLTGATNSM